MRRRILSSLGALLVVFALAPAAQACSCFRGDPRTQLERADGAFVGRLTSVDPAPPSAMSTTYHFKVDDVVKGAIGDTVDVESSTSGASCGYEVERGQEMGFFLERDGSVWRGGLCGQIDPDELRKAAAPYPKPDGTGPLELLVGGSYGDVRTIGLDASGRTLAYGKGDGKTTHLSVCPGSRVVAEIVRADVEPFANYVVLRGLDTFAGVRKSRLVEFGDTNDGHPYPLQPGAVGCRSPSGDDVVVFGANNEAEHQVGKLVRVRPDGHTVVWQGGLGGAAAIPTTGTKAYVSTQTDRLIEVDIETRAVRDIAKTAGMLESGPSLSADGRRVALIRPREEGIDVFDVRTGEVTTNKTVSGYRLVWVSHDRLVLTGTPDNGVVVFDAALTRVGSWEGWTGDQVVNAGGTLYGTNWEGALVSAPALKGPMKTVRTFDSPELQAIAAVPPRAPDASTAPKGTEAPGPTETSTPTTEPTSEPTPSPAGFAAPTSEPSGNTSSPAIPAAALGVSALALGSAALVWRRRSV